MAATVVASVQCTAAEGAAEVVVVAMVVVGRAAAADAAVAEARTAVGAWQARRHHRIKR